ncbi:hypothetical protein C8Q76DRAFT_689557 [Earliella scabrosa]|nr:hypothetical protein C8Q76DRAFT_689557 [Earliella scabrosa]
MTTPEEQIEQYEVFFAATLRITLCTTSATAALVIYDSILSFPEEVERIWRQKYTGATFIYLTLRYSTLMLCVLESLALTLQSRLLSEPVASGADCAIFLGVVWAVNAFDILLRTAIAVVVLLRAYGISAKDWRALVLVGSIALVSPATRIANVSTLVSAPYGAYAAEAGASVLLVLLTWVKTFSIRTYVRGTDMQTPLATMLLKDGRYDVLPYGPDRPTWYSHEYGQTISWCISWILTSALNPILFTRFVLNLRGHYFSDPPPSSWHDSQVSSLRIFRNVSRINSSTIVGNLGAAIRTPPALWGWKRAESSEVAEDAEWNDGERAEEDQDGAVARAMDDPFRQGMIEND